MANLSSSWLIRSPEHFVFCCPSIRTKAVGNVGCLCVVRNDGIAAPSIVQAHNTFSFSNKIYEDQTKGIACYIDQNGEVICEGYDEGPRRDVLCSSSLPIRDDESNVIELLERSWLQEASQSGCTGEGEAEDFLN